MKRHRLRGWLIQRSISSESDDFIMFNNYHLSSILGRLQQVMDTTSSADSERPLRKRFMTAARREQNRNHQRTYRKRQKELRFNGPPERQLDMRHRQIKPMPYPPRNDEVSKPSNAESDFSTDILLSALNTELASLIDPDLTGLSDDTLFTLNDVVDSQFPDTVEELANCNNSDSATVTGPNLSGDMQNEIMDLHQLQSPIDLSASLSSSSQTSEPADSTDTMVVHAGDYAFDLRDVIAAGLEVLTSREDAAHSRSSTTTITPPLPNPHKNFIQFTHTRVVAACLYNARSLGVKLRDMAQPLTASTSPFFTPCTPADNPTALLEAVTKPGLPTHLKPTLPQILYPHHAFFDVLPIPILRSRAITLAATQPGSFDPLELKKDIVTGGLVCWASTDGNSRSNYRKGQPWDLRSWEVAPWFFQKWRMLMDGEDGEAWKYSLWWQRARGERGGGHGSITASASSI
ncbi:hypothetical protein F5884DRAFT_789489 [Xylogone sp. PMI_703]|nr:hypothetical protein F5884DRAFT_789489 [Xylogone sp. PMI_703]